MSKTDEPRRPSGRLDGWGEISAYLKRDPRTLQRWEKIHPTFPIHRDAGKKAKVWAFPNELDNWWQGQDIRGEPVVAAPPAAENPNPAQPAAPSASLPRILRGVLTVGILLCVVSGLAFLSKIAPPEPSPAVPDRIFARMDSEQPSKRAVRIPTDFPQNLVLAPSGDELYVVDHNSRIHVLDLAGHSLSETLSVPGITGAFEVSPDGQFIYAGTMSGELLILRRSKGFSKVVAAVYPAAIRDFALSRDGRHLYASVYRNGLRRYDTLTGQTEVLSATGCAESLALDHVRQKLFVVICAEATADR